MNALRERMRGDPARAAALLEEAAQDPACRPVARLVQAQLAGRHDVLAATLPVDLAPWCDVGMKVHATTGDAAVDRLLGDALEAAPADRLVLAALRIRLAKAGDRIDPPQRKRYVYALVKQPGPWFEAFESAPATAAHAPPDAAREPFARAGAAIEDFAGRSADVGAARSRARRPRGRTGQGGAHDRAPSRRARSIPTCSPRRRPSLAGATSDGAALLGRARVRSWP
jgi:hypothetical protein